MSSYVDNRGLASFKVYSVSPFIFSSEREVCANRYCPNSGVSDKAEAYE